MSLPTPKDLQDAVRRIAMTADGRLLYRLLQIELMAVSPSMDSGALQRHEGRRTLARDLKLLMDEELAKVATSVRSSGQHDPDEPAIVERGQSIALVRGGTRRRVEPYAEQSDKT